MLNNLLLVNYKGFERYTVRFGEQAILVGPNNAGKSTIISALRLCAAAVQLVCRRKPTDTFLDGERTVRGFPLTMVARTGFVDANIRHEFRQVATRLQLTFDTKSILHIVWPVEGPAFIWIYDASGPNFVSLPRAKEILTQIGSVPSVTPLEGEEVVLTAKYINDTVDTRLSSRHFRNHLRATKADNVTQYETLEAFLLEWTPELTSLEVIDRLDEGKVYIDVFYQDSGSRVEKELFWAGDGLHIWLQLLFHIWRNDKPQVLLLDEPDVFLHPDLQRRLVRLLEASGKQTILASHASEMTAEAASGSVIWIDRTRRQSRRVSDDSTFSELTTVLGSAFNLSLARALRSRVALFVEGDDMKLLRIIASRLGMSAIQTERNLAVVPIGGFSRWPGVEAFAWLKSAFLKDAVQVAVWLDRDYRSEEEVQSIESQLLKAGVDGHIWRRKEIENYLLHSTLLAKTSGLDLSTAERVLDTVTDELRVDVYAQYVAGRLKIAPKGEHSATTIALADRAFSAEWEAQGGPARLVPGKLAISNINRELQNRGARVINARKLAARIDESSVDNELRAALEAVESRLG